MAMNYLEKKREEQQRTADSGGGLRGVSQQTQKQLQNYQQGYQAGQQVQQAQQNLQQVQAQKPQSYSSKYGAQLESILQQIQNPGEFKYDFNGDALFKAYADMYTQNAKQGALNAAGIAAGLTGGYGNTYAQSAANQAYQQNLSQLYDRGVDFMNAAYNRYAADRADRYDQMSALQNAENADYNRYRDTMTDYYADLDRAREDARYEDETGYNRYADMLNYWQNQAAAENADWQAGEEMAYRYNTLDEEARQADQNEAYRYATLAEQVRGTNLDEAYRRDAMVQDQAQFEATTKLDYDKLAENMRQFDAGLSEDQRQYNQKMAASWVADILANGQIPSAELLAMAGLSYEDAQKLVAQVQAAGGPGPQTKTTLAEDIASGKVKLRSAEDVVTPEERANTLAGMQNADTKDYAPKTSNLDTPVYVQKDNFMGILPAGNNAASGKNTTQQTTVMTPQAYNMMLQQLFDKDLKKKNG